MEIIEEDSSPSYQQPLDLIEQEEKKGNEMQITGSGMQMFESSTIKETYKTDDAQFPSSLTTLEAYEFKIAPTQNPRLKTPSIQAVSMESQANKNATSGKSSPVLPVDSQTRPAENPEIPATAPVFPPASGIPTEMVVKLFRFLQPDIDFEQMFAQFMANPVAPQQQEDTLSKTQKLENAATGVVPGKLVAGAMVTEEQGKEEESRIPVGDVLAITEVPRKRRLEVKPKTNGAKEAIESPTEEAREAPRQADPHEESARRRRYHKIVVELSKEDEEDDKGRQVPLTKRSQTHRPTHPRVITSGRKVAPRVELPQLPNK